jgi:hypothetical protein
MAKVISSFEELVKNDFERLSMGIRPSGRLHLGSLMTILSGLMYLGSHSDTKFELQVMDLDFDFKRGRVFTPYNHLRGPDGSGVSAREYTRGELKNIVDVAGEELGIDTQGRITTLYFSEFLHDPEAIGFFTDILTDRGTLSELKRNLFDKVRGYKLPVSGICPSCYTSSNEFANFSFGDRDVNEDIAIMLANSQIPEELKENIIKKKLEDAGKVRGEIDLMTGGNPDDARYFVESNCYNTNCDQTSYVFDLRGPGRYNIHYLVDPIRDAMDTKMRQGNDLHIFGGDYGQPSGVRRISKVDRIQRGMAAIGLEATDAFVGPIVLSDGQKMSKSKDNCMYVNTNDRDELISYVRILNGMISNDVRVIESSDVINSVEDRTPTQGQLFEA